ncbi:MAG: DNA topoisomerase (ATP-hydrolyzing) [Snowella sp.]|nr:DNA topoisomerase (ATP-hydrolyzing) [Snowella sp.]
MTRQLKLIPTGQIVATSLHSEMERSYLEYAMSVIVGRALPDVRDGLKPVHRRVLYAMYELGLTPDRPYRKCARVVGDVLGKYHPHGDQSVYDALVRMVQDFSSRYPLLAGHGNFGSVDNDPPAAMRYTETRLSPLAFQATLDNISEAIVDFTGNFDNSQQEPVVLPAQLPILLLNGCSGIAVGMATNIPPHNLGEIVDGLIALIDNPQLSDENLWEIIPGPDFPTGGEILDQTGIWEAYRTGRGLIPVRGVSHIETIQTERRRNRNRTAIIVTELPFQVNKAAWIEKMAELVNQGKLDNIADLRDESDRTGMRVVIELKKEADPQAVLEKLYKQTALQSNFGVILLALVDNKPCQLSLRQLLEEFLKFREETVTRQYSHDLGECQKRLHLLQGLLIALNHLDELIDILRHAADGPTAKVQLQTRLDITEEQADSILAMPMRRITGLERQKLETEHEELENRIRELDTLLTNRHERLKSLKKELRKLKKSFGDERRTRIVQSPIPQPVTTSPTSSSRELAAPLVDSAIASPEAQPLITADVKETPESSLLTVATEVVNKTQIQKPAKKTEIDQPLTETIQTKQPESATVSPKSDSSETKQPHPFTLFTPQVPPDDAQLTVTLSGEVCWESSNDQAPTPSDDPITYREPIQQREQLIVVSDRGKAYPVLVKEIPSVEITRIPLLELLPKSAQRDADRIAGQFFLPEVTGQQDLLLMTQSGRLKRLTLNEFDELGNRGLSLMKFKDEDKLQFVQFIQSTEDLVLATSSGRLLRFSLKEENIPPMGRNAQGNPAVRLRVGESLVGCLSAQSNETVLLLTQLGYGKAFAVESLRVGKLGDIGTTAMQFSQKTDQLVAMLPAINSPDLLLLTSHNRQLVLSSQEFNLWTKDGVGDRVIELDNGEMIQQAILTRVIA